MDDKKYQKNLELLQAYRAGDPAARELLILENSGLVSSIARRYGFKCKAETLDSISNDMNCSREWIRQIERKALRKLRAMPDLQIYRIEQKLDERTDFHRQTEKVVLWRERQRRLLYAVNWMYGMK